MKIGMKLTLGFAVTIILLIVIAVLGITNLSTLNTEVDDLVHDKFIKTVWANGVIDEINAMARALRNAIITDDPEFSKKELQRITDGQAVIASNLDSLERTIVSEEGKKILEEIQTARKVFIDERNVIIDLVKANGVNGVDNNKQIQELLFKSFRKTQSNYMGSVTKLIDFQTELFNKAGKDAEDVYNSAFTLILIIAIVAILLATGIAFWVTKQITKPINQAVTASDSIAHGNLKVNLESNSKDETGLLLAAMKTMSANLNDMVKELNDVSSSAADGKLDKRANEAKFEGEYRNIMSGFNKTLDAVIGPLNVTAEYVDRISKGDIPPKITDEYKGDFNEIKNNLNQCIDAVNALVSDAALLSKAAKEGKLDTRANANRHFGDFREIVQGVNDTLDNVIGPLNVAAEYVDRISKGDIPPKITDNYNGDFNEIKNNLNGAIDAINALVTDAKMLAKAAVEGKLDTRADASKHGGDFKAIVDGVNATLDNVIGPLNVAAEYVDRISKGDIPPKITDNYNGDFNEIKNNLNGAIDAVNALVRDALMLATAAKEGKLDTRADASKHGGDFKAIVDGVNATLDNVIGPLNVAAEYVDRISKGDIPPKITDNYNGDFNEIKNNLNQAIDAISALVKDAKMLAQAAKEGRLATRADASKHQGDFREVVQGVNNTLDDVIGPLNVAADYVDNISKGNIPAKITKEYYGDFNVIKNNLNTCIDAVNLLVADAGMLAKAAVEGKLDTRADATKHQGDFRAIVQGVNNTLDNVIGPLNVAAEYVDRISKGDIPPKITDNYNGDFNEIKNNLNQAIDAVNALVRDAKMLATAAKEGKLATRADANKHFGDFREVVQGVNNTLDDVIGPLNVAADYVDNISKGNIPAKITKEYFGDFNVIKNNLNTCIDAVNLLVSDAKMLAQAAKEGKLATRADASKHQGDFREVVQGVNNTLDDVIGPLNVAAEYVDNISKGNIPAKITKEYFGDFNVIKNNLNTCIDAVNLLVTDAKMLAKAAKEGKLATRADASKHQGDFREVVQGVNNTLDDVIGPLNVAADYVDNISKGNIPAKITKEYYGDFNVIKNNLNTCIDAVNLLVGDAKMLAKAAVDGKLDTRADATRHQGDFRAIVEGVNNTLDNVIGPLNVAAEYVDRISKGDIPPKITDNYNGDFNEIKNNLNQAIDAIDALVGDSKKLAKAAEEGQLATRADASRHQGDFKEIVDGVNKTLDNVIAPINEAAEILGQMATGDLTVRMFGDYKGDLSKLKNDVNALGDSLSQLITQVNESVQNTASAALEISSTAEGLAASSQEQSAQADEVASAVEEMSRTVTENAMSATRTAEVAQQNGAVAAEGAKIVKQTVTKMRDIADVVKHSAQNIQKLGESSKQIGEIISVIDDIADQTNLLALNAAIEAARAGEQGRGFAVVADEVRKLAERTTEATKQIANMIKGIQSETEMAVTAMNQGTIEVQSGIEYADRAGESLNAILTSTQELLDMINQIAAASEQQSATSEQISKNVMSISKVTSESAQRVEDVAHTSEDLAKLTEHLRNLMANFQVDDSGSGFSSRGLAGKPKRQLHGR